MLRRIATAVSALMLACGALAIGATPSGATLPPPAPCVGCYVPTANTSWQIQLNGTVGLAVNATLFDIDGFDNTATTVAKLHAKGRKVACYFSAGSFENWRPDAAAFPADVKGASNGWPGERWLDIRRLDVLGPIIESRLDMCKAKGFDSADPDNVDGYTNTTGFPLTAADQLAFNTFIANAAHTRGLSVALKNDLDQIPQLVPYFDWALNEQCYQYGECDLLTPFSTAGKAVMEIEYGAAKTKFCPAANARNFNAIKKRLDLKAWRSPCR
ncbi:MAG: endo alpha-1,4 polygalactosaminidase [Acidimicrobiia bacterium]